MRRGKRKERGMGIHLGDGGREEYADKDGTPLASMSKIG